MAVEREEFEHPFAYGKCGVPRVMRGENGQWSVEFELNFSIRLADGREIRVTDRHVIVRANEQRGRKPRVEHICGTPSASCDTDCSALETGTGSWFCKHQSEHASVIAVALCGCERP
jgi:hypothetical protein